MFALDVGRFARVATTNSSADLTRSSSVESDDALISLTTGQLRGRLTTGGALKTFLGVPFASPPTGQLRWQPPEPPFAWNGTRDALKYSHSCIQSNNAFTDFSKTSEDCLYAKCGDCNSITHALY